MGNSLVGQTIGQDRIDEWLGGGGFAEVYKGYQPSLDRVVAIKILDDRLARDTRFIERFRREAENTFSLKHENIVQVYDFQEVNSTYFMVMEYIDGPTLRKWLSQKGEFNIRNEDDVTRIHEGELSDDVTVLRELTTQYQLPDLGLVSQISIHVCNALDYAHKQKVVHRDVKPDNVLLSSDGRALLVDFGIARAQEDSRLTRTKAAIGSLAYMSPEQIRGERNLDGRADIYSFGIMFYEMLTGTVPFVGTDTAVFQMHLRDDPLKPSTLRGDISSKLEKVVLKCLKKDVDARYQTAGELSKAIHDSVHPTPISNIFDTGKEKAGGKRKKEKADQKAVICDACGYLIPPDQQQEICPACGDSLNEKDIKFTEKIMQRGPNFISTLNLKSNLSLDVRAYEYDRVVELKLGEIARDALYSWQAALVKGSVVLPVTEPKDLPDKQLISTALNKLNDIVNLWESDAVNAFVVSLEARRRRKEYLTELKAKTCFLYGTYHTIKATECSDNSPMVDGYTTAKAWFDKAIEIIGDSKSDILQPAQLCSQTVENILLFPANCSEAIEKLKEIQKSFLQLKQSWGEKDSVQCAVQINLQDEIVKIPPEMKELHEKVKHVTTALHGKIDPARTELSAEYEEIIEQKEKQKNSSLAWGWSFWVLFLISLGINIASFVQASNGNENIPTIISSFIAWIVFLSLAVNGRSASLNRRRKAYKELIRQVAEKNQLSQQILTGFVSQSDQIEHELHAINDRSHHLRHLLEAVYLHGPTPDLFVEHREREADLKTLQNTLQEWQEEARNLVRQVLQVSSTELYDYPGVMFNGTSGKLAFEVNNIIFRTGGNANMDEEKREKYIRIRIPRAQISSVYPSYNRTDILYAGMTAQFLQDKHGENIASLIHEWMEAGRA